MSNIITGKFDENFVQHVSNAGRRAIQSVQQSINNIAHGMYSDVPIRCQGSSCPYYNSCTLASEIDLTTINGDPCPIEVAEIIALYNAYYKEFRIDINDNMSLEGLLHELIDKDIQIRRADKYISIEADFLEDVITYDKFGNEITTRVISQPIEYKERLMKRRGDLLQLLHATPKDKAGMMLTINDPSSYAASIIRKYKDIEVIEIEPEDYTLED